MLCFHHEAVRPSSVQLPSPHLALDLDTEQKWLLSEIAELAQVSRAAALYVLPIQSACISSLAAAESHSCSAGLRRKRQSTNLRYCISSFRVCVFNGKHSTDASSGPALHTTVKCMPPTSASV